MGKWERKLLGNEEIILHSIIKVRGIRSLDENKKRCLSILNSNPRISLPPKHQVSAA